MVHGWLVAWLRGQLASLHPPPPSCIANLQFYGPLVLVHGPCGPSSGAFKFCKLWARHKGERERGGARGRKGAVNSEGPKKVRLTFK